MRLSDSRLLCSPSDLVSFVACEHLTQLELGIALDGGRRPNVENAYADLIQRKGAEHEAGFLNALESAGRKVTHVGLREPPDFEVAARATIEAMRTGVEYIYQAVFALDGWRGIADFLERVERPSSFGSWSYEVLDTKLARHPRPEHALQLCFYAEAVGMIQGATPDVAYVVLGTRERVAIRLANVSAYFRRVQSRFQAAVTDRPGTVPYPCEHCALCDFRPQCEERWRREDHLTRVAGIRRDQVGRFVIHDITTVARLVEAPIESRIPRMPPETFEALREQAGLQLERERSGRIGWRALPIENGRGLAILPPRSPGDVIFDLEGHPFFEPARGLEFLFGTLVRNGDSPRYEPIWARAREEERRALEAFVDFVHARLASWPDLHVYHFASYEPTAIKRLMGEYGTREAEVDELLRRKVFVDLHTVVRQALRAGVSSYSLKELEALFGFTRAATVKSGMQAILSFERWLATGDERLRVDIAAYNEEDCRATLGLLEWLHGIRPADLLWPAPPVVRPVTEEAAEARGARERLRVELLRSAEAGTPRWLAAEILEYHRREARPAWWWYFERLGMAPEELVDDTGSIGGLEPGGVAPEPVGRSAVHTLRYPPQDHKLGPGPAHDPATGKSAGEILKIDDATGTLRLARGPSLTAVPLPRALIAGVPYDDRVQRDAIFRVGESIRRGEARYPALQAILNREYPRVRGFAPGQPLQTIDLAEIRARALGLDGSYLFVQGPPGTGKTWMGARLVTHLLANGRRVGIAAQSHKAIHNLLDEVERVARSERVQFRGLKKSTAGNEESVYEGAFITSEADTSKACRAIGQVELVAGTAWLFARGEMDSVLDHLVIDEAGQVSLADTLAMGTSARNVILLGDPLQLAQVSQGVHPEGSGASVLGHLLGAAPTIPEDRGVFLERSFRMHPGVCAFISEIVYAGRLYSDESAIRRSTSWGTGIRFIPVEHEGNRSSSEEEVARIAALVADMVRGTFTESDGTSRPLRPADFMVVAPYNAQVRRLQAGLPEGVRIGTVDKFQGQEAPIVFFSMATSSGEDVPRNLAFLFSRNRLNVAISRAQCLAILVCSPRLLEARCHSIEEMELVNALCRLVEYADPSAG